MRRHQLKLPYRFVFHSVKDIPDPSKFQNKNKIYFSEQDKTILEPNLELVEKLKKALKQREIHSKQTKSSEPPMPPPRLKKSQKSSAFPSSISPSKIPKRSPRKKQLFSSSQKSSASSAPLSKPKQLEGLIKSLKFSSSPLKTSPKSSALPSLSSSSTLPLSVKSDVSKLSGLLKLTASLKSCSLSPSSKKTISPLHKGVLTKAPRIQLSYNIKQKAKLAKKISSKESFEIDLELAVKLKEALKQREQTISRENKSFQSVISPASASATENCFDPSEFDDDEVMKFPKKLPVEVEGKKEKSGRRMSKIVSKLTGGIFGRKRTPEQSKKVLTRKQKYPLSQRYQFSPVSKLPPPGKFSQNQ